MKSLVYVFKSSQSGLQYFAMLTARGIEPAPACCLYSHAIFSEIVTFAVENEAASLLCEDK
jgi:hypothetical protein